MLKGETKKLISLCIGLVIVGGILMLLPVGSEGVDESPEMTQETTELSIQETAGSLKVNGPEYTEVYKTDEEKSDAIIEYQYVPKEIISE